MCMNKFYLDYIDISAGVVVVAPGVSVEFTCTGPDGEFPPITPSLLYQSYIVCILFGTPSLHRLCFLSLVYMCNESD